MVPQRFTVTTRASWPCFTRQHSFHFLFRLPYFFSPRHVFSSFRCPRYVRHSRIRHQPRELDFRYRCRFVGYRPYGRACWNRVPFGLSPLFDSPFLDFFWVDLFSLYLHGPDILCKISSSSRLVLYLSLFVFVVGHCTLVYPFPLLIPSSFGFYLDTNIHTMDLTIATKT